MGLFRFSKVSQVPGVGCQNLMSLGKGWVPCGWNGAIRGVGLGLGWNGAIRGAGLFWNGAIGGVALFWNGAIGGVVLFWLNPGFLLLGRIGIMGLLLGRVGIMGKVGMGGVGSSTMELIGVTLFRVLRVPFIQNGQEPLLFQVDDFCLLGAG